MTGLLPPGASAPHLRAPLRLGVLVEAGLRRWQRDCLQALVASGDAVLAVVLTPAVQPSARHRTGWYVAAVGAGCHGLDQVEAPADFAALPRLPATTPALPGIDAVLAFQAEEPTSALPFGTWRFRFGAAAPAELPGQRELAWGRRSIEVALLAEDAGEPLHRAVLRTRRSHRLTLQAMLETAPALLVGACRRLRRMVGAPAPPAGSELAALPPAGPLRAIFGQLRRVLEGAADRALRDDIWSIGVVPMGVEALLAGAALPPPRWLPPPRPGRFHADPFPLTLAGRPHLLFEVWEAAAGRGWIACTPLEGADPNRAPIALDLGCHMSYPFCFTWDGAIHCVPEVSALGGLRLFRMGATAQDWTPVATVLKGLPLLDPTLFAHDGRWWLLASLADRAPDTDLHAWHAPSPLGPWVPHGLNPVVSDARAARPAGAVFRHGSALYRPAQDCAGGYGMAVAVKRILRLDPEAYAEVEVRRLTADRDWPYPDGLHTLNVADGYLIIDAKRRVFHPRGRLPRFVARRATADAR